MKNLKPILITAWLVLGSFSNASFAETFFPLKVGGSMIMIPIYGEDEETPGSKMTPLGTDEDRDGVRDDVQYKIQSTFGTNSAVTNYTMGMARGYQRVLSGNLTNKEINEEVATIKELDACISDTTSDPEAGSAFLLPAQLNTVARTRAYLKAAADAYDAEGPPATRECRNSTQKRLGSSKSKQSNAQPMPKINPPNLKDYGVYFINGVMNSKDSAREGLTKLEDILSAEPIHLEYNENHALGQFFDLYVHKTGEIETDNAGTLEFWQLAGAVGISENAELISSDGVKETLNSWLDPDRDVGYWAREDLKRMIENAKTALSDDKKVIIVAHSEGNFFYRKIWQALNAWNSEKTKQCFAGVGLATPLSSKKGNYKYITSSNDKVMNTVRWKWETTLSANVTVPSGHGDYLGHGLQETYLSHHAPVERLQGEFKAAIKKLDESCQTYRPEPLRKSGKDYEDFNKQLTFTYDLSKTTAHTIDIIFDPESDSYVSMKVKANGKTIATTSSSERETHIYYWKINYDPKVHGSKFTVYIHNNNTYKIDWELCVDYEHSVCGGVGSDIGWVPAEFYEFSDSQYWSCTNYKINGRTEIDGEPVDNRGTLYFHYGVDHHFSADCACTMESTGGNLNKCDSSYGFPSVSMAFWEDYFSTDCPWDKPADEERCGLADKNGVTLKLRN